MVALHRDPERRYADAADMETALVDALQGRAPARDTESTWAMDDTEATRMLAGTQATTALPPRERPRRRLEPIQEARRGAAGNRPRRRPGAAPRRRRRARRARA
jgi:serine/threonine-protein kinase